MEKINKEETAKIYTTKSIRDVSFLAILEALKELEVGESLRLTNDELPDSIAYKGSTKVNQFFKEQGKKFQFKTRMYGKEYYYFRIK